MSLYTLLLENHCACLYTHVIPIVLQSLIMKAHLSYYGVLMLILITSSQAATTEKQQLENRVRAIADGRYNPQLATLWGQMENAARDKIKSKRYQYLLAAHITWDKDSKPSIDKEEVKYYENINVAQAKTDCDGLCQAKVNDIRTKLESTDTLDRLSGLKTRCNTQVHTELQFLYGRDFRATLNLGGVFLIYSQYIPCAGLAKCSLGECAGDLAYGLVDIRKTNQGKPAYFVIMYSDVFKRQSGSTNECTSKLYHTHAGIPMLLCTKDKDSNRHCQVSVGPEILKQNYIENPVFHRFPRVNQASQRKKMKADVFITCLAMGEFLQALTGSRLIPITKPLSAEDLYQRDANTAKLIGSWLSDLSNPASGDRPNIHGIDDVMTLIQRNAKIPAAFDVVNRCNSYISCLPELLDRSLTITNAGDDLSCKVQDELCDTISKRLRQLPEICNESDRKRRCRGPGV